MELTNGISQYLIRKSINIHYSLFQWVLGSSRTLIFPSVSFKTSTRLPMKGISIELVNGIITTSCNNEPKVFKFGCATSDFQNYHIYFFAFWLLCDIRTRVYLTYCLTTWTRKLLTKSGFYTGTGTWTATESRRRIGTSSQSILNATSTCHWTWTPPTP